jgi:hypothetical protein
VCPTSSLLGWTSLSALSRVGRDTRFVREEREYRSALPLRPGRSGQSLSPALGDIIGARRVRTAVMISSGSMPWR